jgi:hypothetical protein
MKKSYISIGLLAVAGVMASCSEDWDNHYEPSDQVAQESVMELIQTDPEAAGLEVQTPDSDTTGVVAGAVDELKIKSGL